MRYIEIKAPVSLAATLLFAAVLLPINPAYARMNGARLTIEPAQTVVVSNRNKIIKVVSNSRVRGHVIIRRNRVDGSVIYINQDIQSQFDYIMASTDEMFPGVVYERERGWLERVMDYFNVFFVHRWLINEH